MSIAFLFPGQGSQRPGMLHRLPDTTASATVLAEADMALRELDVPGGIAELDTPDALGSPVAGHTALLVAGVAGARALAEDEGLSPLLVVGLDAGGYAAAVTAGVLTFEEALRAVRLRGELLERGLPPGHVAVRLAQHLATVGRRPQALPWVSTVLGRCLHDDTNAVFDDLAQSAARPPRLPALAAAMTGEGAAYVLELPPGRVLADRAGEEMPGLRVVSVEEHGIADAAVLARGGDPSAVPEDEPADPSLAGEGWDAATGRYLAGGWGGGA
ncbi:acyltransferase domain-containing protein [Streptomyces sp. HNM0574]|uniref:acyltransferase domain-containing protein n=1 Tax=Streptomyces sp. HNM0574 TaxID=2714954 RepID=UPI00146A10FF|nr:acyltransferase domain-containing protein [Streptomyces sp. HNM0574]NLU70021.1 acyltransferase domain-containing protein [Streptomyces sp. HNM0574]